MDITLWQQREHLLLDALQEAAMVIDEDGTILFANATANKVLNSHTPLSGKPIAQVFARSESTNQDLCRTANIQIDKPAILLLTPCGSKARCLPLPSNSDRTQYLLLWLPSSPTSNTTSIDPVTGLADRQTLLREMNLLLNSQDPLEAPHSLIKIQLAGLEQLAVEQLEYRDTLMADLAALLRQRTRQRDLLVRTSPDSFTLLLKGCNLTQAKSIANKLHQEIHLYHQDYHDIYLPNWHPCLGVIIIEYDQQAEEILQQLRELTQQACQQQSEQQILEHADWQEII